jgi:hypothetical protein
MKYEITAGQLLLPVSLVTFVVVVFLGFQTTLLTNDRASLQVTRVNQEKPLAEVSKIKEQANALAVGTLKLSQAGNKDAQNIIAQLKKAGVDVQGSQPGAAGAAPADATPPAQP